MRPLLTLAAAATLCAPGAQAEVEFIANHEPEADLAGSADDFRA